MFKALLYKLAYHLFAKEVEAYHRLNNAILGINRWCASDPKADLITTHLIKVRDDKIGHSDHTFRERLRAMDKPAVVTRVSVPESRGATAREVIKEAKELQEQLSQQRSSLFDVLNLAHQASMAATIADDDNFRKGCGSHETAWSGSDDSCSSSSASSSGD